MISIHTNADWQNQQKQTGIIVMMQVGEDLRISPRMNKS